MDIFCYLRFVFVYVVFFVYILCSILVINKKRVDLLALWHVVCVLFTCVFITIPCVSLVRSGNWLHWFQIFVFYFLQYSQLTFNSKTSERTLSVSYTLQKYPRYNDILIPLQIFFLAGTLRARVLWRLRV